MDDEKKVGEGLKETFSDKVNKVMRDWIIDIVVIIMLAIYVLKAVVTIEMTEADVLVILGDCALLLVFMTTIKSLMLRKGIFAGEKSQGYIDVKSRYDNQLIKIMPKSQYLADYIVVFNERNKRTELSMILAGYGISYESYVSGVDNPTEYQSKGISIANKAKYLTINIEDLTGSGVKQSGKVKSLGQTKNEFMSNKSITDIGLTVLSVVIFAVFTFRLASEFSWASLIWVLMQLCVFLMKGAMSFISSYMFITEDFSNRVIRQTNLLIEFDSMDTEQFDIARKEREEAAVAKDAARVAEQKALQEAEDQAAVKAIEDLAIKRYQQSIEDAKKLAAEVLQHNICEATKVTQVIESAAIALVDDADVINVDNMQQATENPSTLAEGILLDNNKEEVTQ